MTDYGREEDDSEATRGSSALLTINPNVLRTDRVFGAIDHPRRRYLLYALVTDGAWALEELATKLVAWERDVDENAVFEDERDRMYVSLYHVHVPKLVEYGVIRFDEETETISRGEHAEQVIAVLDNIGGSLDSQQEQHAGHAYGEGSDE
ncbi:MAG: hypothetical protein ABEJ74_06055 [Haloferacaceae archaeon]